jgi:hypothetical protein
MVIIVTSVVHFLVFYAAESKSDFWGTVFILTFFLLFSQGLKKPYVTMEINGDRRHTKTIKNAQFVESFV